MSKEVVETIYGKHYKYEVVCETGLIENRMYYVRCSDGSTSGIFSELRAAVDWANKRAESK